MKHYLQSLITFLVLILSTTALAEMDRACLDNCFCTKHDCDYCRWMCDKTPRESCIEYRNDNPCCCSDLYNVDP